MTTYAIGDLQGCHQRMLALLERVHHATPAPSLIFVGDLINRGPASLSTLRAVRALGDHARVLLGNHDLHLLAVANGIRQSHRSDTLSEILGAPDCNELLDWLRQQPLAYFENGHLLVHAGVLPQWSAEQTMALAAEVEAVLHGPSWLEFLREMFVCLCVCGVSP